MNSFDSRFWGIFQEKVVGKCFLVLVITSRFAGRAVSADFPPAIFAGNQSKRVIRVSINASTTAAHCDRRFFELKKHAEGLF
jgi:hypothetical protein